MNSMRFSVILTTLSVVVALLSTATAQDRSGSPFPGKKYSCTQETYHIHYSDALAVGGRKLRMCQYATVSLVDRSRHDAWNYLSLVYVAYAAYDSLVRSVCWIVTQKMIKITKNHSQQVAAIKISYSSLHSSFTFTSIIIFATAFLNISFIMYSSVNSIFFNVSS